MQSLTQPEIIGRVIQLNELLKGQTKVKQVRQIVSDIFVLLNELRGINPKQLLNIQTKLSEIQGLQEKDTEYLPIYSADLSRMFSEVQNNLLKRAIPPRNYFGVSKKEYAPQYVKARNTFLSELEHINEVENKIMLVQLYEDKLHRPIKYGKFAGYPHARLTKNELPNRPKGRGIG
ncbi:MAG TPA: hypothetical protein VJJ82_05270 [Candidatus Nanoarchaeia archaeon]|nr:hypothetical protein [Candidatus Nanoarchaeia archaeon]